MLVYELIKKKRDSQALSGEEIDYIIGEFVGGGIPNYQMSALLMAIYFRGMETAELASWTDAMIDSGDRISFSGAGPYVDKHSTGGVGDKVSIPLAPLAASLGLKDPMISGRGLGHTGGTLDKLESIPGFRTDLSVDEFKDVVEGVGCCISGQTARLVPADKMLYALRDVTATVDSVPLIGSSILSKKKASGIAGLVMDVKVGSGAFMRTEESALEMAQTLVSLGGALGMNVKAYLTNMDQPLGIMAGNALEVQESIDILKGQGPADTTELVVEFAAAMVQLGGHMLDPVKARRRAEEALGSGRALEIFARMVEAQGGDPRIVDAPSLRPRAVGTRVFGAPYAGYVHSIDCEKVGHAVVALGGGRKKLEDDVDPAVGLEVHARVGDSVDAGGPLAIIHYSNEARLQEAMALLEQAYEVGEAPVEAAPLIRDVVE